MKWDEYREHCKKWRMDLEPVEYIAVLLLGIREEYDEFFIEFKASCIEKIIEEYGDMLFNIAELVNVLEENFSHFRGNDLGEFFAPRKCVEVVRKSYMRDRNNLKFIGEAWQIAERCVLEYTRTNTAQDSMIHSVEKLTGRHG
jgi:hypothetical protein